jgi:hypothetical protein
MAAGAPNSPVFNYTSLDFNSLKSDLIRYAQARFPQELWTDFNDSNFATYLLDMMAYASDLLAYNINAQVLETLPLTVVREQNMINIGKTLDYQLRSATAATGQLVLTLTGVGAYTLSKHLQFSTGDGVLFQPTVDVPIGIGVMSATVDIVAGREIYLENLGLGNATQSESFSLSQTRVIDGTLFVYVNSILYSEVKNIVLAGSGDNVYTKTTNDSNVTTLTFGDGQNGSLLPASAVIEATYKVGGGLTSVVAAGTITDVSGDAAGAPVPPQIVSVTNTAATTGGGPATALSQARLELPVSIKTNDRAVTAQDYANFTLQVPGVQRCAALSGVLVGGTVPVLLFVVPSGGASIDPPQGSTYALRTQILTALAPKRLLNKRIQVLDPVYARLQIDVDVYAQANAAADVVYQQVVNTLKLRFLPDRVDFGAFLGLQEAYDTLSPATNPGVSRVVYRKFTLVPYGAAYVNRTPTGNGGVAWISIDPETVDRREWNILFTAATTFQVRERWPGTLSRVESTVVFDDRASYPDNYFTPGSFVLRPRPQESAVSYPILGNDAQAITVSGNVGGDAVPGDSYVVERIAFTAGKILTTALTAAASSAATLTVTSTTGFIVGDKVVLRDSLTNPGSAIEATVVLVNSAVSITLDTAVTASSGWFLSARWEAPDGSVTFAVDAGTTAFVAGDQIYVDTYEPADDIQPRPENFPVLFDNALVVRVIGGVR